MSWRSWLPVALAAALVGVGLGLADAGRQSAALVILGAGLLSAGVAVGAWLRNDDKED
jgi:hypothetical protein